MRDDWYVGIPDDLCFLVHFARWRSTNARNALHLHPAATSEFPIRQVLKRVSERNAFTSDARQVERKIKRAPFSFVHRGVITLLCGFCRSCAAFTTNRVRARDELSRLSLCRVRCELHSVRIERCVKFISLFAGEEKKREPFLQNVS